MSIFFKDTYATLWDVKPAEKYTDLNISTSEKDKDGNYVNSSWYPRVFGDVAEQFKHMKRGDRFKIASGKIRRVPKKMEDGSTRYFDEIRIFALADMNSKGSDVQGNPCDGGDDMPY